MTPATIAGTLADPNPQWPPAWRALAIIILAAAAWALVILPFYA